MAWLALGAAVNIAVAWSFACWRDFQINGWDLHHEPVAGAEDAIRYERGRVWVTWAVNATPGYYAGFAREWDSVGDRRWSLPIRTAVSTSFSEAGWPMRSVRSVVTPDLVEGPPMPAPFTKYPQHLYRWELPLVEIVRRGIQTDDLPAAWRANNGRRLPLVPIPLGFTVDTLLYAAVGRLAWAAVRRLPVRRPKRRGFEIVPPANVNEPKWCGERHPAVFFPRKGRHA